MSKEILRTLLQEAASQILEGVSPRERFTVSAEFEYLLNMCVIAKSTPISTPEEDELTLRAGRYLIAEVCKVPPVDRLKHLQRELLIEEISDLDASARRLAEDSLKASADLPVLQTQARAIRDQIHELRRVLKAKGTDWEQAFARMLSESSMDCLFVLGETPYSSMRLVRDIRFMQSTGNWPPAWYAELWSEKDSNHTLLS